uniref:Uncharacterized protein n=1 Tax=Rhizophora mucronata TaxID=61149 RepID=A0A2P2KL29_RHIMU
MATKRGRVLHPRGKSPLRSFIVQPY